MDVLIIKTCVYVVALILALLSLMYWITEGVHCFFITRFKSISTDQLIRYSGIIWVGYFIPIPFEINKMPNANIANTLDFYHTSGRRARYLENSINAIRAKLELLSKQEKIKHEIEESLLKATLGE